MPSNAPRGLGFFVGVGLLFAIPTFLFLSFGRSVLAENRLKLRELAYASTPGEITSSEVESKDDGDGGRKNSVRVAYRYTVNGEVYTGTRVQSNDANSIGGRADRYVGAHPLGSHVTVWFDPSDPAIAVLEPGPRNNDQVVLLLLLLVPGVGIGLAWYCLWLECFRAGIRPGFKVLGSSSQWRVPLRQQPTWVRPLILACFGAPAASFACLWSLGPYASPWPGTVTALGVLALALLLYRKNVAESRTGKFDLVVDHETRTVTLPCTFGRSEEVVMAFSAVTSVGVEAIETDSEDGKSVTYRTTLRWKDSDGIKREDAIGEWSDEDVARKLASWIDGQLAKGYRESEK